MIIPRKGDDWSFNLPNRPRRTKRIGHIYRRWVEAATDEGRAQRIFIQWARLPKGRYSGLSLKM